MANPESGDISVLLRDCGDETSNEEKQLQATWTPLDFLIGGPPCQGHSNLNNKSRRMDERNLLALKMARAAEILEPRFVIVENVPTMANDHHRTGDRLLALLDSCNGAGYETLQVTLHAENFGVAQTRHRSFILGWSRRLRGINRSTVQSALLGQQTRARPVEWALTGLVVSNDQRDTFNSPPSVLEDTRRRIQILVETGATELPNEHRPDCHRTKAHSYVSVYGRMRKLKPAPTITTGFSTMGRGRFVHPYLPRLITPHEAARIQFFPDYFQFASRHRTELARAIGNAVPSKLGFVTALALLAQLK